MFKSYNSSYFAIISVPYLPAHGLPSLFISSIKLSLGFDLECDLVLGINWIGLGWVAMLDGLVDFHPSSPECCY